MWIILPHAAAKSSRGKPMFGEAPMKQKVFLAFTAMLFGGAIVAGPALAQSNIDKMRGFKVTGTSLDIPTVPQDPAYIAQLRKNLKHVKLDRKSVV